MKKITIISVHMFTAIALIAQTAGTDPGTMMRPDLSGTARSLGVGGAFSTVGADMSSMSSNPAGIALYRSSEFAVSGGAMWGNTSSQYMGNQTSTDFGRGMFSQAGLIFASRKLSNYNDLSYNHGGSALDRVVVGIGYQMLTNFTSSEYFYGTNTKNSYGQALASNLNAGYNSIPALNAYQTYVADYTDSAQTTLGSKIGLPVNQSGQINTSGALSDINLTLGFNVGNTIYIGAGLGLPYMNYVQNTYFNEGNASGDSAYQSHYNYSLSGMGVNGKFGIIIKPEQWIRFGAAIQTPTYFMLNENANGSVASQFGDSAYYTFNSAVYRFNYYNPLKATFGASVYMKQWGFISVDYELDDYAHTHYSIDGDANNSSYWNNLIANDYRLTSTVRAGIEFAYKKLRLRGGYAWSQSPYRNDVSVSGYSGDKFNYTAGIGYRGNHFFADIAYVRTQYKNFYTPYSYTDANGVLQSPNVLNNTALNNIVATIGFKFGGDNKNNNSRRRRAYY